jgi:mRNA export factor
MRWIESDKARVLCTGGWDRMLKYWDLRQPTPVLQLQLPERIYCMDAAYPLLVVGCAEKHTLVYDLNNPSKEYKVCLCYVMTVI